MSVQQGEGLGAMVTAHMPAIAESASSGLGARTDRLSLAQRQGKGFAPAKVDWGKGLKTYLPDSLTRREVKKVGLESGGQYRI